MDKQIEARFDRVEKALGSLVESIAKYNPSIPLAHELAIADEELTKGLREVQTHQNNYLTLLSLRAASAALDAQIRETLAALASTRREMIQSTATASLPGNGTYSTSAANNGDGAVEYPFTIDELLSYARRISRFTLPPPGVTNGVELSSPSPATASPAPQQDNRGVNGASPQQQQQQQQQQANGNVSFASQATTATATSTTSLPEPLVTHLTPYAGATFIPWPTEEQMLRSNSALSTTAALIDRGIDPRTYDPEAVAAARLRQKQEEEEAQRRREEEERERERRRAEEMSAAAAAAREREAKAREERAEPARREGGAPAKTQFQFMGDIDDDDDE